jgi:hypothetical protein
MVSSYYAAEPETVYGAGQSVTAQSGDAEAISVAVLEDIQAAAESVLHPDDGVTGLHAIGEKVAQALQDYGADWMQPLLGDLISEIIGLGGATSTSAVIVDDADLQAVESFAWDAATSELPATIQTVPETQPG